MAQPVGGLQHGQIAGREFFRLARLGVEDHHGWGERIVAAGQTFAEEDVAGTVEDDAVGWTGRR